MDGGDDLGPFADGPADPFDRAGAGVADREDAGHRGLQVGAVGAAGGDETGSVTRYPAVDQPLGGRVGADEQEDVADVGLAVAMQCQATRARTPSSPACRAVIWV